MRFRLAAILGTPIRQDTDHTHLLFSEERQNPIIEQIGCGNGRLGGVELGRCPLGVSIDKGLLVNPPHALDGADVERVLAAEVARVCRFNLAMGNIVFPASFQVLAPVPRSVLHRSA